MKLTELKKLVENADHKLNVWNVALNHDVEDADFFTIGIMVGNEWGFANLQSYLAELFNVPKGNVWCWLFGKDKWLNGYQDGDHDARVFVDIPYGHELKVDNNAERE